MNAGLPTSVVLHAALLAFGLLTLSAPRAFEVTDVESLPVDIIPVEQMTQIQKGDKKSPMAEKPAPKPTEKPTPVENAQQVGDNDQDLKTPPTPAPKPREIKTAAIPEPSPKVPDKPVDEPKPEPVKVPEPKPVPATEVMPKPQPRQEVKPDPVPEPVKAPEPKPVPVKQPEPKPAPEPLPKPEPVKQPEPKPEPQPKEAAKPTPAPQPEPKVAEEAVKPLPEPQMPKPDATPTEQAAKLPDSAPSPASRPSPAPTQTAKADAAAEKPAEKPSDQTATAKPSPAQAQTAKAPDRKNSDKPAEQAGAKPQSSEKQFNADEVAALLNRDKPSGGGAKRSTQQASLGGETSNSGQKLSQSEMDALRGQIQRCWNIPAGAMDAGSLKVSIKFKLDQSGAIEGRPEIVSGGGSAGIERAAAESARRAVLQCAPYNLPADKYAAWSDVIVNFDPSEMF